MPMSFTGCLCCILVRSILSGHLHMERFVVYYGELAALPNRLQAGGLVSYAPMDVASKAIEWTLSRRT
jgi:hypothetical protein